MKINELVRSFSTWTNSEEKSILEKIDRPMSVSGFTEHERFVIEGLIRKTLLIKVESKGVTYVYPNV